ncbi:MAG: DUF1622 domain-containing protein [Defluviitaleaceae bacterium]|nr:DUF1622 domain-containing protein [Defluviitaleaceae bacterium]
MNIDAISNAIDLFSDYKFIFVRVAIIMCDVLGIMVLVTTVAKSIYKYFHHEKHIKLTLAQGIALALEFKLAGEVMRTVTARSLNELIILGTIIFLRGAITVLIHWEIKAEMAEQEQERKLEQEEKP